MKTTQKFFYLRDLNKHPIACIALVLEGNTVKWGMATCHEMDLSHFTKSRARTIAKGRMETTPVTFEVETPFKVKDLIANVLSQKNVPQRVRKMATLWSDFALVKERRTLLVETLKKVNIEPTNKLVNELVEKSFNL